ncbi:hypothetical protein B0H17DRAFT_1066334 [Mycena rosella]|uniref:Uncharacterized protein n=1 Tax=Mycena rosella TaxID=1033263 RepID=A0AAD7GHR0_MYCRO|nr:hypothetical protein B0H17DRAFT_1066334 [Mycena rosella]
MSSPNMYDVEEDATLHKAKQHFLQHLEEVDTSDGIAKTLVLKFTLAPEVISALTEFVTEHGCSMETRLLTRQEQDAIDKRRKSCAQYTWFTVTPEAKAAYLKNRKTPLKTPLKRPSPKKAGASLTSTPSKPPQRKPKSEKVSTPVIKKTKKTERKCIFFSCADHSWYTYFQSQSRDRPPSPTS